MIRKSRNKEIQQFNLKVEKLVKKALKKAEELMRKEKKISSFSPSIN